MPMTRRELLAAAPAALGAVRPRTNAVFFMVLAYGFFPTILDCLGVAAPRDPPARRAP
jgi:hypothetical protein